MKKLLSAILFIAVVCAFSSTAQAGLVVGAALGKDELEGTDFSDTDDSLKAYLGFRFLKFVGLELQYTDFGTFEDTPLGVQTEIELQRLDAFVLGVIPFKGWEVWGKAGYGVWNVDTVVNGTADDDQDSDLAYGVGVAWTFAKFFAIRAEWERFELTTDGEDGDATMTSIGLDIRF